MASQLVVKHAQMNDENMKRNCAHVELCIESFFYGSHNANLHGEMAHLFAVLKTNVRVFKMSLSIDDEMRQSNALKRNNT